MRNRLALPLLMVLGAMVSADSAAAGCCYGGAASFRLFGQCQPAACGCGMQCYTVMRSQRSVVYKNKAGRQGGGGVTELGRQETAHGVLAGHDPVEAVLQDQCRRVHAQ